MMRGRMAVALICALICTPGRSAPAQTAGQNWPSKPLRIVVPWPAGGSADLVGTWWSFSGPARLPADLVGRLNRELNELFDSGEVRAKLARDAIETEAMSPEQLTSFVADEIRKWGPLAKAAIGAQGSRSQI